MLEKIDLEKKEKAKKPFYKKWWVWVIAGILLIGALGSGNDDKQPAQTASQPKAEQKQPQPEPQDKFIKAGMYKVGTDLPAGEYLIYSEGTAYFQVSKDSSGSLESIVANDNFSGTRYVTVLDGQYLETKGAKMLPAGDAAPQQPENGVYSDGMYKVGKDIAPGEYKVVSTGGMSYLEVSRDSTHNLNSIISNDNFDGEKYITVGANQYIKVNGCQLKTK